MHHPGGKLLLSLALGCVLLAAPARADKADDLLAQAQKLANQGKYDEALALANQAIALDAIKGRFFRAGLYEIAGRRPEALADYTRIIELDPKLAEAYDQRGSVYFKTGRVKEALADFDRFLELRPREKNGHWRRGIALYYAGKFEEGKKQFKGYEAVDANDVENAVWYWLCVARSAGVGEARKTLPKVGEDRRVPLMQVYALYQGKGKPEDVLAAAHKVPRGSRPELLRQQLFYAHLYLGLYYEALGDRKQAREHLAKATKDYRVGHYMGDVARVDLELLEKQSR